MRASSSSAFMFASSIRRHLENRVFATSSGTITVLLNHCTRVQHLQFILSAQCSSLTDGGMLVRQRPRAVRGPRGKGPLTRRLRQTSQNLLATPRVSCEQVSDLLGDGKRRPLSRLGRSGRERACSPSRAEVAAQESATCLLRAFCETRRAASQPAALRWIRSQGGLAAAHAVATPASWPVQPLTPT